MSASVEAVQFGDGAELLATIRQHEAQVELLRAAYSAAMARDAMTYWLAEAARELRVAGDRKMVHIAAGLSQSESTISRFENHKSVPGGIDAMIAAYADDLGLKPIQIWERALELWREAPEGEEEVTPAAAGRAVAGVVGRLEGTGASRQRPARGRPRTRRAS